MTSVGSQHAAKFANDMVSGCTDKDMSDLQELLDMYKVQYWILLEELRFLHRASADQSNADPLMHSPHQTNPDITACIADSVEFGTPNVATGNETAAHVISAVEGRADKEGNLLHFPQQSDDHTGLESHSELGISLNNWESHPAHFGTPQSNHEQASQESRLHKAHLPVDMEQTGPLIGTQDFRNPMCPLISTQAQKASEAASTLENQPCFSPLFFGKDNDPDTFSDAEDMLFERPSSIPCTSKSQLSSWHASFVQQFPRVVALETAASALSASEMDSSGVISVFAGKHNRYLVKRTVVTIGRSTDSKGDVDIDLSKEGSSEKVSRRQAVVSLEREGYFTLYNTGQRRLHVNGCPISQFQTVPLAHLSLIEVGGIYLLFMYSQAAIERVLRRTERLVL